MRIEEIRETTDDLAGALARLVPQLAPARPPPSRELLEAVVRAEHCTLLAALDPGIVGVLTLVRYPIPTGWRAVIEDVVVDGAARGRGIGEALVRAALERAAAAGTDWVDLTSRPGREAANRLYLRLGFTLRETNAYRYTFGR